jgi:hypothetical protein
LKKSLFLLAFIFPPYCSNLPPEINEIRPESWEVTLGESIFLHCKVYDPEDDPLIYSWSTDICKIEGYDDTALFEAVADEEKDSFCSYGSAKIHLEVIDEKGGYDIDSIEISIVP